MPVAGLTVLAIACLAPRGELHHYGLFSDRDGCVAAYPLWPPRHACLGQQAPQGSTVEDHDRGRACAMGLGPAVPHPGTASLRRAKTPFSLRHRRRRCEVACPTQQPAGIDVRGARSRAQICDPTVRDRHLPLPGGTRLGVCSCALLPGCTSLSFYAGQDARGAETISGALAWLDRPAAACAMTLCRMLGAINAVRCSRFSAILLECVVDDPQLL